MSHTSWVFEGNTFNVGENLKTLKPNNTSVNKIGCHLVYYKKKVYYLLCTKGSGKNKLRAVIADINTDKEHWANGENVFWIIKDE